MRNLSATIISVLVSLYCMVAMAAASPDTKITLNCVEQPVDKVLKEIEKQSGLNIVYKSETARKWPKITLSVTDKPAREVIQIVASKVGESVKIDNNIVTFGKETPMRLTRTVTGVVLDEEGEPLAGASVLEKGTTNGVSTNVDGEFQLNISGKSPVLLVSYVGMHATDFPLTAANSSKPIKITLKANAAMMNEVVITGYQEVKKEKMTGAVTTISADKLADRFQTNLLDNLEGRVAGLSTYGGKAIIRGVGTLYGETAPLLVVDGLPIEGKIEDLNPYDIESINVLKDAAAAAIYGARAANGIIVITTKNARKQGKIDIDFSANVTWYENKNVDYHDNFYMNAEEHVAAESKYWEYYFFGDKIKNPIENTSNDVYGGDYLTHLQYAYWQLAKGDISREELENRKKVFSNSNYARELVKTMFHRQVIQQYNLALRSSSDKARNNLVLNYKYDNTGIINHKNDWLNISYKGSFDITKWLTATASFNGVFANIREYGAIDYQTKFILNPFYTTPYQPWFNEDGSLMTQYLGGYGNDFGQWTNQPGITDMGINPVQEVYDNVKTTRRQEMRFHLDLLFRILPGLTANGQFIYEVSDKNERTHANENSWTSRKIKNTYAKLEGGRVVYQTPENGGLLKKINTYGNYWTARGQLNYNNTFAENDISVIAGIEFRQTKIHGEKSLILGYDDQLQLSMNHTVDLNTLINTRYAPYWVHGNYPVYARGFMFQDGTGIVPEVFHRYSSGYFNATYTFDERYNVFGSFRKDYADVYGLNAKFRGKPLWSVGAGWNLHKEQFMRDLTWISFLKLRASYGITGNIYQGATSYMTASSDSSNRETNLPMGKITSPANPDLKWEQNKTINIGLDYSFLDYRLRGSIDYYRKDGKDIFGNKLLDPTVGFSSMNANVANIVNHGVEISVGYDWFRPLSTSDFRWTSNVTLTLNKNKVTYVENPAKTAINLIYTPYKEGYPVNAMWAYRFAGIDDTPGYEGQNLYWTANGVKTRDIAWEGPEVLEFVGQTDPKTIIALDNQISWNGFSFGFLMSYYGGHHMFAQPHTELFSSSWSAPIPLFFTDAWTPENKTDIPGLGQWANPSMIDSAPETSTDCVYDASFIKIRNITFGYDLPKKWIHKIGINNCSLRFQINDPKAIWTANKIGIDPETQGIRSQSSYVVGLNINI